MGEHQGAKALRCRRPRVISLPHLLWGLVSRKNTRYYEWLKKGTQRVPHFTRHGDRRLMLFAGLYDSVTLDGECFL